MSSADSASSTAPASSKRSLESTSDEPVLVPDTKLRAIPCANCARTDDTTICNVITRSGTIRTVLCSKCNRGREDETLFLLDGLDINTGLPCIETKIPPGNVLGDFQDRRSLPRCSLCGCNVEVLNCHPLTWKDEMRCARDRTTTIPLCQDCRVCAECGECVEEGRGIDHCPGKAAAQLCVNCARWCPYCEDVVGDEHFQDAHDAESRYLCRLVCCGCQEEPAEVYHPESERGYCRDCVETKNAWHDMGENEEPEDFERWEEMEALLGNDQ